MLLQKITEDLKAAMRAKDELRLAVIRMLISAIKNKKIELKKSEELSDDEIVMVLAAEVKKRKDSIEAYQAGQRQDLVDREAAEIAVIGEYLPAQLDEAGVRAVIQEVISAAGPAGFGQVMGAAMARLRGQADGNLVQRIVKEEMAK